MNIKSIYVFFSICWFGLQFSNGQEHLSTVKEKPLYRAYYTLKHIRDTTKKEQLYTEKMLLSVGEQHSLFVSYDKLLEHIAIDDYVNNQISQGIEHVSSPRAKKITPEEILIEYSTNRAVINTYLARHFYYPQDLQPVHWEISTEQKKILDLNCYKATTSYMGRTWEAWFTPEIALSAGPWLLRGLPGLIVAANDDKEEIRFALEGLESAEIENQIITRMEEYKHIQLTNADRNTPLKNEQELTALRKTAQKDYKAFVIAQLHIMHDIGGTLDYGVSNPSSWLYEIPNPMVLKEK